MAIVSNINILSTSVSTEGAAVCLYYLKETLKGAGWKILSSSNGSTLTGYPGGTTGTDSIDTVAKMNVAGAWFRITDPESSREYVMMRGSTALNACIKYSRSTKFTGGSPSATTLPTTGTGGDGVVLYGTGTDATNTLNTHSSALLATTTNARFHFIADNSANNNVYPWYMMGFVAVANTTICFSSHEAITTGTCSSLDNDPSWFITAASTSDLSYVDGSGASAIATNSSGRAWYKYGLSGASFEKAAGQPYTCGYSSGHHSISYPTNLGTNPYDGKDTSMNFLVRGVSFPKGMSSGLKYRGMSRTYPDIIDDGNGNQYIYVDKLLVPWPSGSSPLTSA